MKKQVTGDQGPLQPNNPFPHAMIAEGKFVFVSGQGPLDLETREIKGDTLEEQMDLTLQHIKNHLEAAGTTLENAVNMKIYLNTNKIDTMGEWSRMTKHYMKWFPNPETRPSRTCIGAHLPFDILIEIDCIAVID